MVLFCSIDLMVRLTMSSQSLKIHFELPIKAIKRKEKWDEDEGTVTWKSYLSWVSVFNETGRSLSTSDDGKLMSCYRSNSFGHWQSSLHLRESAKWRKIMDGGGGGGLHSTELVAFLLLTRQPHIRFSALILMLLRIISGTGLRKVDGGLKLLIKPVKYWQVALVWWWRPELIWKGCRQSETALPNARLK